MVGETASKKVLHKDIHYFALDKGELALAEVAKKKANNIDTESITTGVVNPFKMTMKKGQSDDLNEVDKRECEFLTDFCTKLEMDKTACQTEIFQEVHEEEQEIGGKSSMKVVHFGLV
ncbi:hypothetical protein E2320_019762 [Naja naja]|nr:hypothetical protein E2320_019762 [Naja naja]